MHNEANNKHQIAHFTKSFIILLPLLIFLNGCGNDEVSPDPTLTATSQICNRVTGAQAIYWDISNGIPRVDLPNGQPPVIDSFGGSFFHPDSPTLSFEYPQGWNPVTIRAPQTAGVNLVRQDGQAIWRWLSTSVNGFVTARQVRDFEITTMRQNLGLSNNVADVCVNEGSLTPFPGITQSFSNILITVDGTTALIAAQTTNLESLPTTQTSVQVAIGPSDQFDALIFDVYLAIGFQLLYGDRPRDSDGDGTIDLRDNFPNDPTRI